MEIQETPKTKKAETFRFLLLLVAEGGLEPPASGL